MSVTHIACGGALTWKALVDDAGDPGLLPWCPACHTVVADAEMTGPAQLIVLTPAVVAEARLLAAALAAPVRLQ